MKNLLQELRIAVDHHEANSPWQSVSTTFRDLGKLWNTVSTSIRQQSASGLVDGIRAMLSLQAAVLNGPVMVLTFASSPRLGREMAEAARLVREAARILERTLAP